MFMSYRKIWEAANGPIPYDNQGRRMEIHHIDGDRRNNSLENLKLVTIQKHYNIHYSQGDWAACQSIANRMKISPEEKGKMCSELAKKRIADGTHHFQDPEFIKADSIRKSVTRRGKNHPLYGKKMSKDATDKMSLAQKRLVEEGRHHLQQPSHRNTMRKVALAQLHSGTHVFQQPKTREKIKETHSKLLKDNKHPFNSINRVDPNKIKVWCEVCKKETTLPAYNRFHKH